MVESSAVMILAGSDRVRVNIGSLPIESLAQIFSYLNPTGLVNVGKVSNDWEQIIASESIWRDAFKVHYGITSGNNLGRRLDTSSWQAEYTERCNLIARWTRSRSLPNLIPIPKDRDQDFDSSPISFIHLNFPSQPLVPSLNPAKLLVLAVSLPFGRAAIFSPFPRHFNRPLSHFYLNSLTTDPASMRNRFASYAVSSDGSRLIWGMKDGSIRMVYTGLRTELRGIEASESVRLRTRERRIDGHRREQGRVSGDEVSAIGFDENEKESGEILFVSVEGVSAVGVTSRRKVIIWRSIEPKLDSPLATLVWEMEIPTPVIRYTTPATSTLLSPTSTSTVPVSASSRRDRLLLESQAMSRACQVAFSSYSTVGGRSGIVVLGMNNGDVHVWTGVNLGTNEAERARYHYLAADQAFEDDVDDRGIDPDTFFFRPVRTLVIDTSTSTSNGMVHLLVHRMQDKVFYRYCLPLSSINPVAITRTTFGTGEDLGVITCIATDFAAPLPLPPLPPSTSTQSIVSVSSSLESTPRASGINSFGRRKYLWTGDDEGRVRYWDWENESEDEIVKPGKTIQVSDAIKITALEIGQGILFVGGLDGVTRAYDPLSSFLIRTFKDRTTNPRHAFTSLSPEDEARCQVSQIRSDRENVVACVGGKLITWSLLPEVTNEVKKKKKGRGSMGGKGDRRLTPDQEWREQLLDTMEPESEPLRPRGRITLEYGLPSSLSTMTEDEAVGLAMMLSVEEEEERENSMSRDDVDLDFDSFNLDENVSMPSSSIPPSSPSLPRSLTLTETQSNSWRAASNLSSPSFSPNRHGYGSPRAYDKLQLSPRLGPTYGSFDRSAVAIPDMSEEFWPIASSPSSSTPARSHLSTPVGSSTPIRRGWNDVVQSSTASSSPSLLSAQFRSAVMTPQQRQEEEELKFAIEMSLAEEASRRDL